MRLPCLPLSAGLSPAGVLLESVLTMLQRLDQPDSAPTVRAPAKVSERRGFWWRLVATAFSLLLIGAGSFLGIGYVRTHAQRIVSDTLPGLTYAGEATANLAQGFNRTMLLLM